MCVAVPGVVISIGSRGPALIDGVVQFPGRTLRTNLVMVPDVEEGDNVIVHSGYAIRIVARNRPESIDTSGSIATGIAEPSERELEERLGGG